MHNKIYIKTIIQKIIIDKGKNIEIIYKFKCLYELIYL